MTNKKQSATFVATREQLADILVKNWDALALSLNRYGDAGSVEDAMSELKCKLLGVEIGNGRHLDFTLAFDQRDPRTEEGHCKWLFHHARARLGTIHARNEYWNGTEHAEDLAYNETLRLESGMCNSVENEMDTMRLRKELARTVHKVLREHQVKADNARACWLNVVEGRDLADAAQAVWGSAVGKELKAHCNKLSQIRHRVIGYLREELRENAVVAEYRNVA